MLLWFLEAASIQGNLPTVAVGGASASQGLLLFDLTQLPLPGSRVAWARLRFYVGGVTTGGAVDIAAANTLWSEATVTGLNAPGAGAPVAAGVAISSTGYVTVDVTGQVVSWLNGAANDGLLFTANPLSTSFVFDSKESPGTSHPASLEIVFTGPAGAPGVTGPTGATGAPGVAGVTGPAGPTGVIGSTGPAGAAGPTGAQGAQGTTGSPGAAGATGDPGSVGQPGPTGATGVTGTAGATGPTGSAGSPGATGSTGPQGFAGANGATGATGQGPAGAAFTNIQSTGTIANGGTISDSDTTMVFYIDNSAGNVSMTLPHASSGTGKLIRVETTVPDNLHTVTINAPSGNLIFNQEINNGTLNLVFASSMTLISDGGTRWLRIWQR